MRPHSPRRNALIEVRLCLHGTADIDAAFRRNADRATESAPWLTPTPAPPRPPPLGYVPPCRHRGNCLADAVAGGGRRRLNEAGSGGVSISAWHPLRRLPSRRPAPECAELATRPVSGHPILRPLANKLHRTAAGADVPPAARRGSTSASSNRRLHGGIGCPSSCAHRRVSRRCVGLGRTSLSKRSACIPPALFETPPGLSWWSWPSALRLPHLRFRVSQGHREDPRW